MGSVSHATVVSSPGDPCTGKITIGHPNLGRVRLQNHQIEYELKVRQKERVPSCFDTRLWLCARTCANMRPPY